MFGWQGCQLGVWYRVATLFFLIKCRIKGPTSTTSHDDAIAFVYFQNVKLQQTRQGGPSQSNINYFGIMKENIPHFQNVLKNILIPRVPGTKGNEIVRNVIIIYFLCYFRGQFIGDFTQI